MSYHVFYFCQASGDDVPGSDPQPAGASEIPALARRMLRDSDDFFGVVDGMGTTLQIAVVDEDEFLVEVPDPEQSGSYSAYLDGIEVFTLLESLPYRFGADTVPRAKFQRW